MKRLFVHATALLACAAATAGTAVAEDFTLTILHTNDMHSRIEPIDKYDSTCSAQAQAKNECFGGSARLATAITAARQENENTLLLDGGDQFQGSLFFTNYKGKAAAEMMNRLGYQAMTVGNHEFDEGPETLAEFIRAVDFPVLMANADVSAAPDLANVVKPSTVVTVGGEKIGLIGVTPADTGELTAANEGVTFSDPIPAVKREVEKLTADGVTRIVLLSHSGYVADKKIAAEISGIDAIVGGHSHSLLSNDDPKAEGPYPTLVENPDGVEVPIVQAASYGKYLGELTLTFDETGKVTKATGAPIFMDGSIAEDSPLKARIAELAKPLEALRAKVVGTSSGPIDGNRETCRLEECAMGDLVADAMLDRVKDQGAQIAITNGGGLRASIDEGDVTMGEVLTVLPFQNTLSTFRLTGAGVRKALENGVSQIEETAGRFPQVAGIRYTWSPDGKAGEDRIKSVEVETADGFVPLDPQASYLVVSNNFMRGGGDGYSVFAEDGTDAYDYGPTIDVVLSDYLAGNDPYEPNTDGRITKAP